MLAVRIAPFLTFLALSVAAHADDGFLTYGGSPRLLSNHPSIRMARERVVIDVRPEGYHVEATFVFRNDGPACNVRMGFPDRDDNPDTIALDQREQAKAAGQNAPALTALKGFRSWVDGKPVKTLLLPDANGYWAWHAKDVAFRRGATRTVRVAYDADGGGATASPKYVREAAYVLHTGASWHGPIGHAEVVVRFAKGTLGGPIRLVRLKGKTTGYDLTDWAKRPKGAVVWKGYAKPTVHGREIRFVRRSFEPKRADDVSVVFGYGHEFR